MDSLPAREVGSEYEGPVGRLLTIGKSGHYDPDSWPDYTTQFGITQDQIGALIRMACDPALNNDDTESCAVWAPVHAWRTLGQLRAEPAIGPLIGILGEDDDGAALEELPCVLGMIGPAAIVPLVEFLTDLAKPVWCTVGAVEAIKEIALRHAVCRDECIVILQHTLEPEWNYDAIVVGFAIWYLTELAAVETIDAIRAAFARDAVDISVGGDLEDIEIALGLRTERATPGPPLRPWLADRWAKEEAWDPPRGIAPPPRRAAVGRNEPCPCGSGKKYKKCCL
jgi:hypothetical protein